MKDNNQPVSFKTVLENIRNFIDPSGEDFQHIPIASVNAYLVEEGVDVSAVANRILKKIEKMKAKDLLAKANHKRKELIERSATTKQQTNMVNIRDFLITRLNDLTQKQKMVLAHRDLSKYSDEDLASLLNDLNLLDKDNENA